MCPKRAVLIDPVAVQVPVAGWYSAAVAQSAVQLSPPQPDYQLLGSDPWPCIGQTEYYCAWTYSCQCPQRTHAAQSGPLAEVCLCD